MNFQNLLSNSENIRGFMCITSPDGKVVFLGSAPKDVFPLAQNSSLALTNIKQLETKIETITQPLNSLKEIVDYLLVQFDWDSYLVKQLKLIQIHTNTALGRLQKNFQYQSK